MCDALGGLGVGGAAGPYAVSAANAILYALFSVVCIIAGAVNNRMGLNYGLAIGSIGYPLYGAGLYTNNYKTNTWLLLFVPAACGISAGFFYAAEAAIVIGYPSHSERAFYLTIWATAEAVGPIIGGAINLGTNVKRNYVGQVSDTTYIIFMVMCLGLPIALCLSPASKVWRKDGTLVIVDKQQSWAKEFKMIFELFLTRRILMLLPAFFVSYFFVAFQYCQSLPLKIRARVGFLIVIFMMTGTWLWAIILQKRFYDAETRPILDWGDEDYPATFLLSFFWWFGGQGFKQCLYWLIGQYSTNLSSLSHHTGILRGIEAVGQTVAWAIQSQKSVNHFTSIGLNLGITVICIVPAWIIISELEHSHDIQVTDAELNGVEMKTEQLQKREAGKN
ncbi:hypothetical protein FOVG_17501 [Fusarium oxysporum f. sp. pisi HDV247]|uniref:Uncharacterized protein n=1 Tax=Fusarium oxysporum f. sp. pisi HDV247 TaxID=1080344 RepID=W9NEH6_FUSOX|nr:hypothetical protein FOVG_17501 [Fusarium oxysporum f. sp. pisi HDV247]